MHTITDKFLLYTDQFAIQDSYFIVHRGYEGLVLRKLFFLASKRSDPIQVRSLLGEPLQDNYETLQ
jgi:hypothetical protein